MRGRSDDDEPLLANDSNIPEDAAHAPPSTSPGGLGGLFIWALTFAAGISGLLFGYEYEITQRNKTRST